MHVRDTTALTLKNEICAVLSRYNLHIENIRGQGYDGASNMRGEWNGLQALFLKDCPYAYYVHCMAHRFQLALVTASREVKDVHQFFDHLVNIINIVVGSSKRNDEHAHVLFGYLLLIYDKIAKLRLEKVQTKLMLCNELEILGGDLIFILFVI